MSEMTETAVGLRDEATGVGGETVNALPSWSRARPELVTSEEPVGMPESGATVPEAMATMAD